MEEAIRMLAVGMAAGLGLMGPALGLGLIGYATVQALGRNPEARPAILTNMILVAALTEAIGIYALIVSIILAMVASTDTGPCPRMKASICLVVGPFHPSIPTLASTIDRSGLIRRTKSTITSLIREW